jgi:plasmid segregation protein ParM
MFVVGLDIGYSNLKVAVGDSEQREPEFHTLPVGAGPEEYLPIDVFGTHKKGEGIVVNVDGETFVAGVEPWEFAVNGWIRELHDNYSNTITQLSELRKCSIFLVSYRAELSVYSVFRKRSALA